MTQATVTREQSDRPHDGSTEPTRGRTFVPALFLMSGRTLGFAVSFLIPVVLVRLLDQTEFGTYKQMFLIAITLYAVGQLGMAESLFYFLPLAPRNGPRFVANSLLALALGGVCCLLFLGLGGEQVSHWLSNPTLAQYGPGLGLYLLFMLPAAVLEIMMVSLKRYRLAAASYSSLDVLRMALLVGPVFLWGRLEWLLVGAVVFAAIRCAAALWYVRWEFKGSVRPDGALLKHQLAYAVPFQLSGIVETLQGNVHQYAVSHYFDAATFAIYSVGCLQIPLVDFVASSVCNVMMVRMAEELRDGHRETALLVWRDTTRRLALVFAPLVALLLVTAQPIITFLFTERYAASVPVFMVSSLAVLLAMFQVDGVLRVYAQTRLLFALNVLRLALVLSLISWSLSTWHLVGAIGVTVSAVAVMKTLAIVRLRTVMGVSLAQVLPWRSLGIILGVAAAAAAAALVVRLVGDAPPLAELCAMGVVYAIAYSTGLALFGVLSPAERLTVKGWLARFVPAGRAARAGEGARAR